MMGFLRKLAGRSAGEMGFLDHLEELRRVLLSSIVAIGLATAVAYAFSAQLLDWIVSRQVGEVQFLHPMEAFSARFKLALLLGLMVSLPFVMFEIWSFVVPGLLGRERRIVLPLVVSSVVLFFVGVAFSYWVLTPMMLSLLMSFGTAHVKANITLAYLLDFIVKLALASGLLFQLPLVVAILSLLSIVTPKFLWSKWRHAIVIILIVTAIVTPGDGPSQVILAAPIVVLYFLSILVSLLITRRKGEPGSPAELAPPSDGAPSGMAETGNATSGGPRENAAGNDPPDAPLNPS